VSEWLGPLFERFLELWRTTLIGYGAAAEVSDYRQCRNDVENIGSVRPASIGDLRQSDARKAPSRIDLAEFKWDDLPISSPESIGTRAA
jgi:hypothetical protein